MQKTEYLITRAQNSLDQSEAGNWDDADRRALQAQAAALIAIAQELKLANDLKLWELGLVPQTPQR